MTFVLEEEDNLKEKLFYSKTSKNNFPHNPTEILFLDQLLSWLLVGFFLTVEHFITYISEIYKRPVKEV